jgi:hypothetical protein
MNEKIRQKSDARSITGILYGSISPSILGRFFSDSFSSSIATLLSLQHHEKEENVIGDTFLFA